MDKNAFIFDMDGVIIDSEPFWWEAQIEVLSKYNVLITENDCIKYTMGRKINDIALIWSKNYQLTISPKLLEKVIISSVVNLINKKGEAKKGLY